MSTKIMNGKQLQKQILDWITAKGGYPVNIIVASRSGTHDIIACMDGHFYSIEVKGVRDTVKQLQTVKAKQVIAAGGTAIIAYSLDDVRQRVRGV